METDNMNRSITDRLSEFRHITAELEALKNRVRRLISDRHFPTDGEWKESIIRTMLKRYIPSSYHVGRGFVVTTDQVTTQLDIMLIRPNVPSLFRDGDLYCVTPDTVSAILEVKTKTARSTLPETMCKLGRNLHTIRSQPGGYRCKGGLIVLDESGFSPDSFEDILSNFERETPKSQLNYVSIGLDLFAVHWQLWPNAHGGGSRDYDKWHIYRIEGSAPAYFIISVVESTAEGSFQLYSDIWYPEPGKEQYKVHVVNARSKSEDK